MPFRSLHKFGQHAAGRFRVEERHAAASDAGARLSSISRSPAARTESIADVDVVRRVRHVVHARAVALEVLPDGRVGPSGAQQLDVIHAHIEQHGLHALLRDGLAVLHGHAQPLRVEGHGLVEITDGTPM